MRAWAYGSLPFVPNQNGLFLTFIICPKLGDFLWWGGVVWGGVYGGKMDFLLALWSRDYRWDGYVG